jgi:CRP-like cAMP-binding protein
MQMLSPERTVPVRQLVEKTVLGQLSSAGLDELCASALTKRYEAPTLLSAAGQPMRWIWLVVDGQVDIFDRQALGHESIVGVVGPGRWVSWVGLFMVNPQRQDFSTAAGTTLISVPANVMRRLLAQHPDIYPSVIDEIGSRMQLTLQWVGQSPLSDPAQRLAAFLHCLARIQAVDTAPVQLTASQVRLAQTLGISRQLVGKCLETLEREGLVRRAYGRIEIENMARLAAFATRPVR